MTNAFLILTCLGLSFGFLRGPAGQATRNEMLEHPLVPEVREVLRKENPNIELVAVLEVKSASALGPHVLIGWGMRSDRRFVGNVRDELYGVFLLTRNRSKVERVLDVIPTPRWGDYELHVEGMTSERVTVVGKGSSYGDQPLRRAYSLKH